MRRVWPWVAGIVVSLFIIGLVTGGRVERQNYWAARGATVQRAQPKLPPTDLLLRRSPGR